jgi:N-acetylglucosaminyldiphosphoundecaprenol N-acetyl-beta-D-mannosaminyltransferase
MKDNLPSIKILGTEITIASEKDILEYIIKRIRKSTKKFYIVTPNPEILIHATRSKSFQAILNGAMVSIPDGIGVPIAGRILRKQIIGRVTGVDLMDELCRESALQGLTVGFLGGRGGVAELTAECLREKYPGLIVKFVGEEWDSNTASDRGPATPHPHSSSSPLTSFGLRVNNGGSPVASPLTNKYAASDDSHHASQLSTTNYKQQTNHIDILFVAFGFPRQEEWIAKNLPNIDVTVAMGVGGAFDYISGKVHRAPKFVRRVGMEWAFRLGRQPWRVRRQLALPVFVYQVTKEKLHR